jgi:hypothetical protein
VTTTTANAPQAVETAWVCDECAGDGQLAYDLEWLANRGLTDLLQRTAVVLNDSDGHR